MSLLTFPELAVIRRMLRANIRHAEIARRLGMPVETVTLVGTSHKLRRRRLDLLTEDDLPDDYDAPPDYLAANLRRCQDCGGMVYQWPCLACRLRAAPAAGIVLPDEEAEEEGESGGAGEWETDRSCAPTGQPAIAQGAALGLRMEFEQGAPTGRAELGGNWWQRAPLGLGENSGPHIPGLRPGLS